MKSDRWLQRLLRLPARPLQIPEIVETAEEHLQAVAMEGLSRRYLPDRLSVAVASDDHRALEPFAADLRQEMQKVLRRIDAKERFFALAPHLVVELLEGRDLKPGSPPRFQAAFPSGKRRATWSPETPWEPVAVSVEALRRSPNVLAATPEAAGRTAGLFEIVLTTVSEERTGLQMVYVLCLEETLPVRAVADGDSDSRLILDAEGRLRDEASGEVWQGAAPRIHELEGAMPVELDGSVDIPPEARSSKLCRFYRPGRSEVFWAPQGLLLVGRRSELVHWVPSVAPRNLSGRHFALLKGSGRTLRVVDLRSTNGTFLGGRRLEPFERVQVAPPETVEVGTEGTMRLDLRHIV